MRPGARSTHSAPMDTLLISPMVMSIRPVTSHRPANATSAATDSRAASSAVPGVTGLA